MREQRARERDKRDERQARARQTSTTYFYCTYRSHPTSRNFSLRHARPYTPFHSQVNFFSLSLHTCFYFYFSLSAVTSLSHLTSLSSLLSPLLFSLSSLLSTCNYSTSSRNTHTRYQLLCVKSVSVSYIICFTFPRVSSCLTRPNQQTTHTASHQFNLSSLLFFFFLLLLLIST